MRKHLRALFALAFVALAFSPEASGDGIAAHNRVTRERGELAFGSITATTAGTAHTVLTTTKDTVLVSIENTTNVELIVTLGGVDFKRVPAGNFRVFDVKADGVAFGAGVWGVYRAAAAPGSGNLEILALPHR